MIVSVLNFGAKCDGSLQNKAFQEAIDACFLAGGGEVQVPEGEYIVAGIRLRCGVTLHLLENAVLKGTRNPEDYLSYLSDPIEPIPEEDKTDVLWSPASAGLMAQRDFRFLTKAASRWNSGLIKVIHARNVAIIGEKGSVIDGMDCFDEIGEEYYRGPHAIHFYDCENITLRGYTVKDSANWAHNLNKCRNILAENLTVLAGHDGIHMSSCDEIIIRNCQFYTGDDSVAGFDNNDVTVENCILNSACSAFRFGGNHVRIHKCYAYAPCKYVFRGGMSPEDKRRSAPSVPGSARNNMLSFFTYYSDPSLGSRKAPGDILITDCVAENADRLLHYNFSGNEPWQCGCPLTDITFKGLTAIGVGMSLNLYAPEEQPVKLQIEDSILSFRENATANELIRTHSYDTIRLENLCVVNLKANALVRRWDPRGELKAKGVLCDLAEEQYVTEANEEFICKAI